MCIFDVRVKGVAGSFTLPQGLGIALVEDADVDIPMDGVADTVGVDGKLGNFSVESWLLPFLGGLLPFTGGDLGGGSIGTRENELDFNPMVRWRQRGLSSVCQFGSLGFGSS